ncbi:putative peptidyl-tRNA hydrolase PTRHD1 [Herrania umbratica]|uniref:peptidyl-tRNA hydrolase n=1 Tax=Herrania umbratica TaxID=108875 RepID=A0A6J0ZSP0_9ROSI|nr:putative peptidyl-tRNA hydrolase PTRHD1 [Herrania umbratica]
MMATVPSLCRFTAILGSCFITSSPRSCKIRVHPHLPICLITRKLSSSSPMSQPSCQPAGATKTESARAENDQEDVLVQYVVLRRDLIESWPLGSVVTQACHASVCAIWSHKDDPHTLQYCSPETIDSMHKVTLEVKGETQILNLSEKLTAGGIAHKLWIEQPENIPTCLATKPYPKSIVSVFFKKLKLCK